MTIKKTIDYHINRRTANRIYGFFPSELERLGKVGYTIRSIKDGNISELARENPDLMKKAIKAVGVADVPMFYPGNIAVKMIPFAIGAGLTLSVWMHNENLENIPEIAGSCFIVGAGPSRLLGKRGSKKLEEDLIEAGRITQNYL